MSEAVDLRLTGGRLVSPGGIVEAGLAITDGRIIAVARDELLPEARRTIDAKGGIIMPGVVDPETHIGCWRPLPDDFESESRAAAACGVTTWGFQTTSPMITNTTGGPVSRESLVPFSQVMERLLRAGERSIIDYFLTPIVSTDEQVEEIPALAREWGVTSYKYYLHTLDPSASSWKAAQQMGFFGFDDGTVYLGMEKVAELGDQGIVSLHCENAQIARIFEERLRAAGRKDFAAWDERSPHFLEVGHLRHYGYYAGRLGCRLYVQHVTNPLTVQEIERQRAEGVKIYGQSGTHYLTLNHDTWKLNTPLRSDETIASLWPAVAAGRIDALGSDHVNPAASREEMEVPGDMWATVSGFASRVEALLPMLLSEGVNAGRITLERAVEMLSENPAKIFGLYPQKGCLAVGSDADVVVVDLDRTVVLGKEHLHTQAGWSIWEGRTVKGWPVLTIARGDVVAEWPEGRPKAAVHDGHQGRYLPRAMS